MQARVSHKLETLIRLILVSYCGLRLFLIAYEYESTQILIIQNPVVTSWTYKM